MKPNPVNSTEPIINIRIMRSSPVGPILFSASSAGLKAVEILSASDLPHVQERHADQPSNRIVDQAVSEMKMYFAGNLQQFTIPVDLEGLTDFQKKVLKVTKAIPFGKVLTYGEVAEQIGKPHASRAVGGALGRNPISIIIPCHRVVARDGRLHGYSSPNGIAAKAVLLEHEGLHIKNSAVVKTED